MATSHFTEAELMEKGESIAAKKKPMKSNKETWTKVKLNGVDCMVSSLGRWGILFQSSMNGK